MKCHCTNGKQRIFCLFYWCHSGKGSEPNTIPCQVEVGTNGQGLNTDHKWVAMVCGEADESRPGSPAWTQRKITDTEGRGRGKHLGKLREKAQLDQADLWDLLARIPEVWIILLRNQDFFRHPKHLNSDINVYKNQVLVRDMSSCQWNTAVNTTQPGQESEGRPRECPWLDRTQPEPKDLWKYLKIYRPNLIEPERICRKIQNISKFRPETQI